MRCLLLWYKNVHTNICEFQIYTRIRDNNNNLVVYKLFMRNISKALHRI